MMAYANQEDYKLWLKGRSPVVPITEFDFWADRAASEIDLHTANRLKNEDTLAKHTTAAIAATCELAEYIWNNESGSDFAKKAIKSYSLGRSSVTFVDGEKSNSDKLRSIIYRIFANTGLLYKGC